MISIFGGLFEYENNQKLDDFVNSSTKEHALKIIELAIEYCQQNGNFTLEESFILYKMLNKLNEKSN